jgi:hypothetical protein
MNYEQDLKIDETSLDVEWLDQPVLFMKYARHSAEKEKEKDEAKEELELTKAELDKEIRSFPDRFGIEKITDKVVENTILLQKDYKEASETFLQAKFEWMVAKGAVDAFNQRKEALENLVKLNGQSYFAGPQIPRDLHEQRGLRQKEINSRIGRKIERTR